MRIVSLLPFVILVVSATSAIGQEPSREWRYFGGDKAFTRYAPLDQIDRHNVDQLEIVWRRPAVDPELRRAFPDPQPNAYLKTTPVIIDGVLYAPNAFGLVEAFVLETGETIWRQPPVGATA
jgi:quinoprotein glucose dehydrogenase